MKPGEIDGIPQWTDASLRMTNVGCIVILLGAGAKGSSSQRDGQTLSRFTACVAPVGTPHGASEPTSTTVCGAVAFLAIKL